MAQRLTTTRWKLALIALVTAIVLGSGIGLAAGKPIVNHWGNPYSSGWGNLEFSGPEGIALAPNGDVYVADTYNNRIQEFTALGHFIRTIEKGKPPYNKSDAHGGFNRPYGVAVDSHGLVYVADTENNRIEKFTADGTFIRSWGNKGAGDGEFESPKAIALSGNSHLYVSDTFNNRIQEFGTKGDFVRAWGTHGRAHGEFRHPGGIAVDPHGDVYVVDTANQRVQKFTAEGRFMHSFGENIDQARGGDRNYQFRTPFAITTDTHGHLFVGDYGRYLISEYTLGGHFLESWASGAVGMAYDPHSQLYTVSHSTVQVFGHLGR